MKSYTSILEKREREKNDGWEKKRSKADKEKQNMRVYQLIQLESQSHVYTPDVSAHYPMSALSTVIICRQVVETATADAFFLFEDDEWCVPVSINLIGRGQMCNDLMK